MYLHGREVSDYLGLGSEWSAQSPVPYDFAIAYDRCGASLVSEAPFHQKDHLPVFLQELPLASVSVVAVWQSPQGGGVLALPEHLSLTADFPVCPGPPWSLQTSVTDYHLETDH